MAVRPHGKKFQARIIDKRLPKGKHFKTFDKQSEAEKYEAEVIASLNRGLVPALIINDTKVGRTDKTEVSAGTLDDLIIHYRDKNKSISQTDKDLCKIVLHYTTRPNGSKIRIQDVNFVWLLDFCRFLRVNENLAPGSVRSRVGLLGRAWRWHHAVLSIDAPDYWKDLPDGYPFVTSEEEISEVLDAGGEIKTGKPRDRRLAPGEYEKIVKVMEGERVNDDVVQPLVANPEMRMLFILIANTGLRLREAYRIRLHEINLDKPDADDEILAHTSKGHRGATSDRIVPLVREVRDELRVWIKGLGAGADLLFPGIWDGSLHEEDLRRTSNSIARKLKSAFKQAGCDDLHEHDLRHEATCRFYECKDQRGNWVFNDAQMTDMLGWSSIKMAARYASFQRSNSRRLAEAGL